MQNIRAIQNDKVTDDIFIGIGAISMFAFTISPLIAYNFKDKTFDAHKYFMVGSISLGTGALSYLTSWLFRDKVYYFDEGHNYEFYGKYKKGELKVVTE